MRVAQLCQAADRQPRGAFRVGRRQAAADVLVGEHGDVRGEFLVEIAVER